MRTRTIGLVTAVALLGAAGPAQAAWNPAATVSDTGRAFGPFVAFDAAGVGHVGWEDDDAVRVATLAPGATAASGARDLIALGDRDAFPEIAFDADGRAIVALSRGRLGGHVRVAFEQADGTVSAPRSVSSREVQAGLPVLRADAAGDAIVAWGARPARARRGGFRVQYAIRRAGEGFGPVRELGGLKDLDGFQPNVAVSPGGRVVIASQGPDQLQVAAGTLADGLGAPRVVGRFQPNYAAATVAIGDDGRAVVAWKGVPARGDEDAARLLAVRSGADGTFGVPQQLFRGRLADDSPTAAVTTNGTAIVAWPGFRRLQYAEALPDADGFGAAATLAGIGTYAIDPSLSTAPDGAALLTWTRDRDGPHGQGVRSVVQASVRPAGGTFGPPAAVSAPNEEALRPVGATTPDGHGLLAWVSSPDGYATGDLQTAALTP